MSVQEQLATIDLFSGLDASALDALAQVAEPMVLAQGQVLLEEGSTNAGLYAVVEGRLRVSLPDSPERFTAVHLRDRRPGDVIGEYSVLDHRAASARVEAAAPRRCRPQARHAAARGSRRGRPVAMPRQEEPARGGVTRECRNGCQRLMSPGHLSDPPALAGLSAQAAVTSPAGLKCPLARD
jgi:hypothetical protein